MKRDIISFCKGTMAKVFEEEEAAANMPLPEDDSEDEGEGVSEVKRGNIYFKGEKQS